MAHGLEWYGSDDGKPITTTTKQGNTKTKTTVWKIAKVEALSLCPSNSVYSQMNTLCCLKL